MRFVTYILGPAILLACIGAEVFAQPPGPATKAKAAAVDPRLMAEFKASDTNKDGVLDRQEVDARVKRMAAGSKRLTPAQADKLTDRYFTLADANRNGKITPVEMQALLRAVASRYDTNGDGTVSLAERAAARAAIAAEAKGKATPGR
ncbi:EF-hand domain-containing protein [Sphingomonas rubra]|uniref:EF hand n=1 Tax=Sphingomonas rubra TaxID=634430 RepID=A0A1I5T7C5_9SPHN|nr:EF-hand domain-containing protein [Sphingomonas rubra]SFP78386.1 EF hand [Sphingomonas rubra]